jgi:hypothetical protein
VVSVTDPYGRILGFLDRRLKYITLEKTPWPKSASALYRPSARPLSVKLVPTFTDRGWNVVRVTNPYGRILDFLDRRLKYITLEKKRTVPTERPPLVGKVSANFCG